MLGILVGLAAEARLARPLGGMVAIGGGDHAGAIRAAERLVAAGAHRLLSFGLAGGLDPALRPGTILVPAEVVTEAGRHPCDPVLRAWLGSGHPAPLFGGTAIAATAAGKARLHADCDAAAIDLESGALAETAARHAIPFAALRVVCDGAERSLPPAAMLAMASGGRIPKRAIAASLLRDPRQVSDLLRLAGDTWQAYAGLRRHVRQLGSFAPGKPG